MNRAKNQNLRTVLTVLYLVLLEATSPRGKLGQKSECQRSPSHPQAGLSVRLRQKVYLSTHSMTASSSTPLILILILHQPIHSTFFAIKSTLGLLSWLFV